MSEAISKQAAAWVAKADRGLSEEEQAALAAWRASDPRCEGAYQRAQAIYRHYDRARALGPAYDPAAFEFAGPRFLLSRRTVLWGGSLAASLAGVGLTVGWSLLVRQSYRAKRGEVRLVSLSDGSRLTLDSLSRVNVRYSRTARELSLTQGEALFDVAKNQDRPFVVDAGDVRVRAVGTSFSVRRIDGRPTEVMVREGIVEIVRTGSVRIAAATTPLAPVRLVANQRAVSTADGTLETRAVAPLELENTLAWRNGMIAFKHTTLKEAAEDFERYSDTMIVIDDPALATQKITGLYSSSDPVGFARAVGASLGLNVTVEDRAVRLTR